MLVLASVGSAVVGCGIDGTAVDPVSAARQVPDRYGQDGGRLVATTGRAEAGPAFWPRFRAPELDALIARAGLANLEIAQASARVAQYEAVVAGARTALFPSGSLGATTSRTHASASTLGVPASAVPEVASHALGISTAWEIDVWGRLRAGVGAAEHGAEASRFDEQAVRLSVEGRIATAYFQICSLAGRRAALARSIRLAADVEAIMRQRVAAGTATEIDLAQQEAVVLQLKATMPGLERAAEQSRIALALLSGVAPGDLRLRPPVLAALTVPRQTLGLPVDLLRHRPDVRRSEEAVLAAASDVEAARAAMLPSLTLSLRAGFESPLLATLVSPASGLHQITAGITQPLFDAPRLAAALRQGEARRDELVAAYRAAVLAGLGDVESALVALRTAEAELTIRQAVVDRTERAYRLANEQLAAGQIDVLTSITTQRGYFDALDAVEQARFLAFQSAVTLYLALGGGWLADPAAPKPAADRHART